MRDLVTGKASQKDDFITICQRILMCCNHVLSPVGETMLIYRILQLITSDVITIFLKNNIIVVTNYCC